MSPFIEYDIGWNGTYIHIASGDSLVFTHPCQQLTSLWQLSRWFKTIFFSNDTFLCSLDDRDGTTLAFPVIGVASTSLLTRLFSLRPPTRLAVLLGRGRTCVVQKARWSQQTWWKNYVQTCLKHMFEASLLYAYFRTGLQTFFCMTNVTGPSNRFWDCGLKKGGARKWRAF